MHGRKYLKNKLNDVQIRQAAPKDRDYWLDDGASLRLLVKTNGTKCWRFNYRFTGKQKTLALGVYPNVSLKDARTGLADAKLLLSKGLDPSFEKKRARQQSITDYEISFQAISKEWWEHESGTWTVDHARRVWLRLKDNTFPDLGSRSISDIRRQDVLAVIRKIENRGALDVAQRVLHDVKRVFRYAVVNRELLEVNPVSEITAGVVKGRTPSHRPSLPREQLPEFLKLLDKYHEHGRLLTQLAIQLLIYTFVRPGELRGARWEEFDFKDRVWRIPGHRMKMKTDHIVPLSDQAIEVLKQIQPITGQYDLVFPSERRRTECMSDNTMRKAMFKLGYDGNTPGKSKAVPHGFRATASSILNETGFNPDAIERQLSHMERNGVRAAYTHHARYLDDRKTMMQWWADYLDDMRNKDTAI